MNLRHRAWLFRNSIGRLRILSAARRHGICAEIGVWKGDFSHRILQVCRPKELHLIDPWLYVPTFPGRWYGGSIARSQEDMDAVMASVVKRFAAFPAVAIHRGKSVEVAAQFSDGYFDWVYIDGDHSYQAVLDDLEAWYPKIKPGGVIGLDDLEWRDESNQYSVKAAIETFISTRTVRAAKAIQGQFLIRTAL